MITVEPHKPVVLVDFTDYMNLLKIKEDFEKGALPFSEKGATQNLQKEFDGQPLNSLEKDLNKVDNKLLDADLVPTHTYEGNPYAILSASKIKVRGILDKLMAHPVIGPALATVPKDVLEAASSKWLPVIIYKTLYENVDGEIWVRMEEEFKAKFQPVK